MSIEYSIEPTHVKLELERERGIECFVAACDYHISFPILLPALNAW